MKCRVAECLVKMAPAADVVGEGRRKVELQAHDRQRGRSNWDDRWRDMAAVLHLSGSRGNIFGR